MEEVEVEVANFLLQPEYLESPDSSIVRSSCLSSSAPDIATETVRTDRASPHLTSAELSSVSSI